MNDDACIASFASKKRLWVAVALPTAAILLLSIFSASRGEASLALQLAGLAMLGAFALATALLCRCPRCRAFVYDRQTFTPGWTLRRCPHCEARLRQP